MPHSHNVGVPMSFLFLWLIACRPSEARMHMECAAGNSERCLDAALEEVSDRDVRLQYFVKCANLGEPACFYPIRATTLRRWDLASAPEGQVDAAVHSYAVKCNQGHEAACYELGNFLLFDFVNGSGAVQPFQYACDQKYEDSCLRMLWAKALAKHPERDQESLLKGLVKRYVPR